MKRQTIKKRCLQAPKCTQPLSVRGNFSLEVSLCISLFSFCQAFSVGKPSHITSTRRGWEVAVNWWYILTVNWRKIGFVRLLCQQFWKIIFRFKVFFFKLLLGCPTANFGPLSRGQPHSSDVNHCVFHFRPEGHQEPRSEVGFLSPAEHLLRFEPGTFRFLLQRLNPLGHSPLKSWNLDFKNWMWN